MKEAFTPAKWKTPPSKYMIQKAFTAFQHGHLKLGYAVAVKMPMQVTTEVMERIFRLTKEFVNLVEHESAAKMAREADTLSNLERLFSIDSLTKDPLDAQEMKLFEKAASHVFIELLDDHDVVADDTQKAFETFYQDCARMRNFCIALHDARPDLTLSIHVGGVPWDASRQRGVAQYLARCGDLVACVGIKRSGGRRCQGNSRRSRGETPYFTRALGDDGAHEVVRLSVDGRG